MLLLLILLAFFCYPAAVFAAPATDNTVVTARRLIEDSNYAAAIKLLDSLISKEPQNAIAYSTRSWAKGLTKDFKQAYIDNDKALSLAPKSAEVHSARAAILLVNDKPDEALKASEQAIALDPKYAMGYLRKAKAYEMKHNYKATIKACDKAMSLNPQQIRVYIYRAVANCELKNYSAALKDLDKALLLKSNKTWQCCAYCLLARVHVGQNKNKLALEECNRVLAFREFNDENRVEAYCTRAKIYYLQKDYKKELADINSAIALDPKQGFLYDLRGFAQIGNKRYKEALEDYSKAIELGPKSGELYGRRSFAYEKLGQFHNAYNDSSTAIKLSPKDTNSYHLRAYLSNKIGQFDQAVRDSDNALKLQPKSSAALGYKAFAYEQLNKPKEALIFRTKIIEKNPKEAWSYDSRARLYEALGDLKLAAADRDKAKMLAKPGDLAEMAACQPLYDFSGKLGYKSKLAMVEHLKRGPIVLNFFYDQSGHICVPTTINGHKINLMLDTGCSHSDIWNDKVKAIAKPSQINSKSTKANGDEYKYGFVVAKELTLGNLRLMDVPMYVEEGQANHPILSGYLAGNLLEPLVVTIDYLNKQVIFSNSAAKYKTKTSVTVPISLHDHQPYLMVKVNQQIERQALVDTGSPGSLTADSLVKPVLSKALEFNEHSGGPWIGEFQSQTILLNSIELGKFKVDTPTMEVYPAAQSSGIANYMLIGNNILSNFKTVSFDFPARELILEPNTANFQSALSSYKRGRMYLASSDYHKSIDWLSRAIRLDKDIAPSCYFYRANACSNLKQYDNAIKDLDEAIKIEPDYAYLYYLRGNCQGANGNYQRAVIDFSKAIKLDPQHENAYEQRAQAFEQLGRGDLAARDKQTAKKIAMNKSRKK